MYIHILKDKKTNNITFREDFDKYLQQAAEDRRRTEEDRMYLEKLLEQVRVETKTKKKPHQTRNKH